MQTYLKPTLIPENISKQLVKMETPNRANPFDKSKTTWIKVPPKKICVVSNVAMPRHRSVILINPTNPEKNSAELPKKNIQQNSNQIPVNNFNEIIAENMKIQGKGQCLPLKSPSQVSIKHIKKQRPLKCMQTPARNLKTENEVLNSQISVQNCAQQSVQYVTQKSQSIAKPFQSCMQISEKDMKNQSGEENSQMPLNSLQISQQQFEARSTRDSHSSRGNSVQIFASHTEKTDVPEETIMDSNIQSTVHSPKNVERFSVQKHVAPRNISAIRGRNRERFRSSIDPGENVKQENMGLNGLLLPILPPKLQKILPKSQLFDPNTLPMVLNRWPPLSVAKPDIVIIPKKKDLPFTGDRKACLFPGNKRPLLRISIEKEYCSKPKGRSSNEVDKNGPTNDTLPENGSSMQTEMTINNPITNTAVTFKLDPTTREIVLITSKLDGSDNKDGESKSMTEEQKTDDIIASTSLDDPFAKGPRHCSALQKQLRILKHCSKQEENEILELQNRLSKVRYRIDGKSVHKICSKESPKPKRAKRQDTINSVQPDDFVLKVEKTKHDIPRRRDDLSRTETPPPEKESWDFSATDKNGVQVSKCSTASARNRNS